MKKYLALYLTAPEVLDDWMKKPAEERKAAEEKMQGEWRAWMAEHGKSVIETAGAGKTKVVSTSGVADTRNNIMMFSIVEAESDDDAAKLFVGHPHFGIPNATIEVMPMNPITGMQ